MRTRASAAAEATKAGKGKRAAGSAPRARKPRVGSRVKFHGVTAWPEAEAKRAPKGAKAAGTPATRRGHNKSARGAAAAAAAPPANAQGARARAHAPLPAPTIADMRASVKARAGADPATKKLVKAMCKFHRVTRVAELPPDAVAALHSAVQGAGQTPRDAHWDKLVTIHGAEETVTRWRAACILTRAPVPAPGALPETLKKAARSAPQATWDKFMALQQTADTVTHPPTTVAKKAGGQVPRTKHRTPRPAHGGAGRADSVDSGEEDDEDGDADDEDGGDDDEDSEADDEDGEADDEDDRASDEDSEADSRASEARGSSEDDDAGSSEWSSATELDSGSEPARAPAPKRPRITTPRADTESVVEVSSDDERETSAASKRRTGTWGGLRGAATRELNGRVPKLSPSTRDELLLPRSGAGWHAHLPKGLDERTRRAADSLNRAVKTPTGGRRIDTVARDWTASASLSPETTRSLKTFLDDATADGVEAIMGLHGIYPVLYLLRHALNCTVVVRSEVVNITLPAGGPDVGAMSRWIDAAGLAGRARDELAALTGAIADANSILFRPTSKTRAEESCSTTLVRTWLQLLAEQADDDLSSATRAQIATWVGWAIWQSAAANCLLWTPAPRVRERLTTLAREGAPRGDRLHGPPAVGGTRPPRTCHHCGKEFTSLTDHLAVCSATRGAAGRGVPPPNDHKRNRRDRPASGRSGPRAPGATTSKTGAAGVTGAIPTPGGAAAAASAVP